MKSLKKVFFCLALCLLATSVFSQESDENTNIMGGLDGVFDRADYEEQASNPEVAYAVVDQLVQSIVLVKLQIYIYQTKKLLMMKILLLQRN